MKNILFIALIGLSLFTGCATTPVPPNALGAWTSASEELPISLTLNPTGRFYAETDNEIDTGTWLYDAKKRLFLLHAEGSGQKIAHLDLLSDQEAILTSAINGKAFRFIRP